MRESQCLLEFVKCTNRGYCLSRRQQMSSPTVKVTQTVEEFILDPGTQCNNLQLKLGQQLIKLFM